MGAASRAALLLAALGFRTAAGTDGSSVILLRHCPRSPYASDRHPPAPPNGFKYADNFSATPFPTDSDWGVREGQCTTKGLDHAREIGAALRQALGLSTETEVWADGVARCEATAAALGLNASAVSVDQALFDPLSAKLEGCGQPDWDGAVRDQVAKMATSLATARDRLAALQKVLGKGVAPPLQDIPDEVLNGYLVGGLRIASESIVESFVLERQSELPVAWGQLTDDDLAGALYVRTVYFRAMYGGKEIAQRYASGILAALDGLASSPDAGGPKVLVGHDLNVMGVGSLLGLRWKCGTWAENATEPLSGFIFTRTGASVRVQAVCPSISASAPIEVQDASFAGGNATLATAEFTSLVRQHIAWQCVNKTSFASQRRLKDAAVAAPLIV